MGVGPLLGTLVELLDDDHFVARLPALEDDGDLQTKRAIYQAPEDEESNALSERRNRTTRQGYEVSQDTRK